MARGRMLQVFATLALSCCFVQGIVYTRCQLTRELLKLHFTAFSRTFLSNWVCLIEQESERNTSAFVTKSPRRKYYGLFQIGSEYCKEGRKGGKCEITCESLLDNNIKDDAVCAEKVFELEGFKYWSKWEARCKGHTLPDIEKSRSGISTALTGARGTVVSAIIIAAIIVVLHAPAFLKRGVKRHFYRPSRCPDWQHPPSRSSPIRDKRTLPMRSTRKFSFLPYRRENLFNT